MGRNGFGKSFKYHYCRNTLFLVLEKCRSCPREDQRHGYFASTVARHSQKHFDLTRRRSRLFSFPPTNYSLN